MARAAARPRNAVRRRVVGVGAEIVVVGVVVVVLCTTVVLAVL